MVINYRNHRGDSVNEVLMFDGDLVREGHGASQRAVAQRARTAGPGAYERGPRVGLSFSVAGVTHVVMSAWTTSMS